MRYEPNQANYDPEAAGRTDVHIFGLVVEEIASGSANCWRVYAGYLAIIRHIQSSCAGLVRRDHMIIVFRDSLAAAVKADKIRTK